MITINSKIDLFNKVVLERVEIEYRQLLEEVEIANEMILSNYQKEAAKRAEKFVLKMEKEAALEKKRRLSKVKGEVKSRMLNTRAHLIDDLVKAVEDRARTFVTTQEYGVCLLKRFEESFDAFKDYEAIIIEMVDKDILRFKETLIDKAKERGYLGAITFEISEDPIIGGIVVYNSVRSIKIDESIRSIISENYALMGQKVHKMLKEEGEVRG